MKLTEYTQTYGKESDYVSIKLGELNTDVLQQILDNQEKAKWWDKTYDEVVTDECEINNNEMAFFCLKEDSKKLYDSEQENTNLKQKLEKIEEATKYLCNEYGCNEQIKEILEGD